MEERRRLQLQQQRNRARERRQAMTPEQREQQLAQRRATYHQRRIATQHQTGQQLNLHMLQIMNSYILEFLISMNYYYIYLTLTGHVGSDVQLQLQLHRIQERQRREAMTSEQRERHLARRRATYHQRRQIMQEETTQQLNLPIQHETSQQVNLHIQNEGSVLQQISGPTSRTEHNDQQSQLQRHRIRDRERRQAMTTEQRQHHLAQRRSAYHNRRRQQLNQPIQDEGIALQQISGPTSITEHDQRQSQLHRRRIRDRERKQAMTAEQRQQHLAQRRNAYHRRPRETNISQQNLRRRTRTTHNIARNFTESSASISHRLQDATFCSHCTAKLFQHETESLCCTNGKTVLPPIHLPEEIRALYTDQSEEGQHFRRHIRSYNHVFSFTSMGVHIDHNLANARDGVYTFRAQGSIYHKIGSLLPHPHTRPRFLQLYIYDTDHETDNRIAENTDLDRRIIDKLQHILDTYNQFVHHFRQLSRHSNIQTCKLIIKEQPSNQRQYALPSASQVAAIIVGDDETSYRNGRDIIVQTTSGSLMNVQEAVGYYDPLQYPLLLPYGSYGWDINSQNNTGVRVTCREFYAYILQIREQDTSLFLHGGRLLQQYAVDNYVKIESNRMRWVRQNQAEIRSELYIGLQDALNAGENNADSMEVQFFQSETVSDWSIKNQQCILQWHKNVVLC